MWSEDHESIIQTIQKESKCSIIDGAPYEGKLSRTVWSGGKPGDNIKWLPIAIVT